MRAHFPEQRLVIEPRDNYTVPYKDKRHSGSLPKYLYKLVTNYHQTITNLQPISLFFKCAFVSLQREARMMAASGFPLGVCLNVLLYTLTGKSYLCSYSKGGQAKYRKYSNSPVMIPCLWS